MAEVSMKLKQRNPQKVTPNQEMTNQPCLIILDYL